MTLDELSEVERLIAESGLPLTRESFDSRILMTIDAVDAIRSRQGRERQARKRNLLLFLPILLLTSLVSFSAGRILSSHSEFVGQGAPAIGAVQRNTAELSEEALEQLVYRESTETVWGLIEQL